MGSLLSQWSGPLPTMTLIPGLSQQWRSSLSTMYPIFRQIVGTLITGLMRKNSHEDTVHVTDFLKQSVSKNTIKQQLSEGKSSWWSSVIIQTTNVNVILKLHVNGLVQERRNSIANTLELHLSCTNPSMWSYNLITYQKGDPSGNDAPDIQPFCH